jgi:RteC protein
MMKPFDSWYASLEKGLKGLERGRLDPDQSLKGIMLTRDAMDRLRDEAPKYIRNEKEEVWFFRDVWPVFFSKLLLYIWLYRLELRRRWITTDEWVRVIETEEQRADDFFRESQTFWWYYRSKASIIDEQFTRAYGRRRIFDPLAMIIDSQSVTLASYRAAKGLAFEEYLVLLKGELRTLPDDGARLAVTSVPYEFDGTDAEGQEWLMELFASKVIRSRGGDHLNLSELNRWFKYNFGREFGKFFDKMNILRNRKVDPIRFLHKRMRATEQWMARKNGKG